MKWIEGLDAYDPVLRRLCEEFKTSLQESGRTKEDLEGLVTSIDFFVLHYLEAKSITSIEDAIHPDTARDYLKHFLVHNARWTDIDDQKKSIEAILAFARFVRTKDLCDDSAIDALTRLVESESASWFQEMERFVDEDLESWQADSDFTFEDESLFEGDDEGNEFTGVDIKVPDLNFTEEEWSRLDDLQIEDVDELESLEDDEAKKK